MRIRTGLRIAALVPMLMALVVGCALVFSYQAVRSAQERGRAVKRVISGVNGLNSLVGEYLIYHEERPRQQFLAEHDSLTRLLSSLEFPEAQRQGLGMVRGNTESLKELFADLTSNYELLQRNPENVALKRTEERLAGQLLVRSRQAVADGLRLERLIDDGIASTQARVGWLVVSLILATTLPLTFLLMAMMRSVSASIRRVQKGTEIIGSGDLAHRIGMPSNDEMGLLSQAFDRMTGKLQASEKRLRDLSVQLLAAQEEERRRMALEIHDGLSSTLSAAKHRVERILADGANHPEWQEVAAQLSRTMEESRRVQMALRPSVLDDLGMLPALNWLVRETVQAYPHIRVEKQFGLEENDIPEYLKTVIFRVSQEAVNNIAKHSAANLVNLSLQKVDSRIELSIQDNGRGFDPAEASGRTQKGLGLLGMRERTELSGGFFHIESARGKGTMIRATWRLG
ncbi:MAG: ATP-binding protein [bacterium]